VNIEHLPPGFNTRQPLNSVQRERLCQSGRGSVWLWGKALRGGREPQTLGGPAQVNPHVYRIVANLLYEASDVRALKGSGGDWRSLVPSGVARVIDWIAAGEL